MAQRDPAGLIFARAAERLAPPRQVKVSEWLSRNLILVDGPNAGELWSADGAPYLVEIADCLADDYPCNLVTVRKSQQTGASILALGWTLFVADHEPANVLYAVPGIDALRTLNSQKLQPLIEAWQKRTKRQVFAPTVSRSGAGSTTYEKKFGGNWLALANANAVMDLSMVTPRKGVKDELSKWALIDNDQDPEALFFGRFTSHRRLKSWKILEISTPEIDSGDESREAQGHCRIDRSFHRSDQRYWNIACPECAGLFVQTFDQFRVDEERPSRSAMACPHCGHLVSEAERVLAVRQGKWIASSDEPDRHPGFHIDAFMSLMMNYEAIAEDWIRDRKTESGRKAFSNLVLGLPHRYRGDAPDHAKLMSLRVAWLERGRIPADGLILVASADVQMRGIWVEVKAFTKERRSYVVDAFYIDGSTEHPTATESDGGEASAFDQLKDRVLNRDFEDAYGGTRRVDALGVDSGYRSHVVYAWVRKNQRIHADTGRDVVHALDGRQGWGRPAIGAPVPRDIDLGGEKVRGGVKLWPVGTWPLKGEFYSSLRAAVAQGRDDEVAPGGFGEWLDETYFRQITAETLDDIVVKGRHTGRRWQVRPGYENHYLDCAVYNLALAEHLGLSSMTARDWGLLASRRGPKPEPVAQATTKPQAAPQRAPVPTWRPPQGWWTRRGQHGDDMD